ncbi:hypothetical protein SESBI_42938 [Sesbania bispinosa]|nr:hypothetical protein SESBI_42938 [Sesbania bispinosa]
MMFDPTAEYIIQRWEKFTAKLHSNQGRCSGDDTILWVGGKAYYPFQVQWQYGIRYPNHGFRLCGNSVSSSANEQPAQNENMQQADVVGWDVIATTTFVSGLNPLHISAHVVGVMFERRQRWLDLISDAGLRVYASILRKNIRTRNECYLGRGCKGSRLEGVYDFWILCVRPRVLLGFIVTDTMGLIGGALFPFLYRPDRVCRQFGLDQPSIPLDLDPLSLQDAMRAVLFVESQELPSFDSALFVPPGRVGHILDEWVIYQGRLKASVAFFEGVKSTSPPHEILIVYKDPYYTASVTIDQDKSGMLSFLFLISFLAISCSDVRVFCLSRCAFKKEKTCNFA